MGAPRYPAPAATRRGFAHNEEQSPRVVICGTFHRELEVLEQDFQALVAAGCEVLSPIDVAFVDEVDGFVLGEHELDQDPHAVESRHLSALEHADLVWLHAPDGYVGSSAAMELGVAHTLGVAVFGRELPRDVTLRQFAEAVGSIEEALVRAGELAADIPSRPLDSLQAYYARVAEQRGYGQESAQDTMLLLTEEFGELARAVRKRVGLARAGGYDDEDAAQELADVQLYLVHLANVLGVRLGEAVSAKERVNAERFALATAA